MSRLFEISNTPLSGLLLLRRLPVVDERGSFERLFCSGELYDLLDGEQIVQINRSSTRAAGSVRGMHFQSPPHTETKLVTCLKGEVFDVAVDVRRESPTFLRWHAEVLTGENHMTLYMPRGFAHGFQTLTDDCELLYFHTAAYSPHAEGGLNPRDPALAIEWPRPVSTLSARDSAHPMLTPDFAGI